MSATPYCPLCRSRHDETDVEQCRDTLAVLFDAAQTALARLQALNESLAERVAAQSALLTRRAEKPTNKEQSNG